MNKPNYYIASFSGGKDSTAMLIKIIENPDKYPLDEIIFCDTGLEFPDMYTHIEKVKEYINKPITILKNELGFEFLKDEVKINRRNPDKFILKYGALYNGNGWPNSRLRWCTSSLKRRLFQNI